MLVAQLGREHMLELDRKEQQHIQRLVRPAVAARYIGFGEKLGDILWRSGERLRVLGNRLAETTLKVSRSLSAARRIVGS